MVEDVAVGHDGFAPQLAPLVAGPRFETRAPLIGRTELIAISLKMHVALSWLHAPVLSSYNVTSRKAYEAPEDSSDTRCQSPDSRSSCVSRPSPPKEPPLQLTAWTKGPRASSRPSPKGPRCTCPSLVGTVPSVPQASPQPSGHLPACLISHGLHDATRQRWSL